MLELILKVRVHLLPRAVVRFVADDDETITLDYTDPARVTLAAQSIQAGLDKRGATYAPVLVGHKGAAVGAVLSVEETERGIDAVLGLTAEGVAAWRGSEGRRDFVSGGFRFYGDGTVDVGEISLTPVPQFNEDQQPIAVAASAQKNIVHIFRRVDASAPASYSDPDSQEGVMDKEEIKAMVAEALAEAMPGIVDAVRAAMEPPPADDEPEPEPEPEPVAASEVAAEIAALKSRLATVEASARVRAAIDGAQVVKHGKTVQASKTTGLERIDQIMTTHRVDAYEAARILREGK